MDAVANAYSVVAGLGAATIAQLLVAGATFTLAIFTYRSVRAANKSAEATTDLAEAAEREVAAAHTQNELAEKTFLASIQPVLSDFPMKQTTDLDFNEAINRHVRAIATGQPIETERRSGLPDDWVPWAGTDDERKARAQSMHMWSDSMLPQAPEGETAWGITTLFKNVGNGAAIVERASLVLAGKSAAYETRTSKLLIAQDDYCRVTFNVRANDFPDPLNGGMYGRNHAEPDFFVDISYSNVSGSGRLRTRQRIQITRDTPHITAIELWDQESGKLLAISEYFGKPAESQSG